MRKIALVFLLISSFFSLNVKSVLAADPVPSLETVEVSQTRDGEQCNFFNSCIVSGQDVTIKITGIAYDNGTPFPNGEKVEVDLIGKDSGEKICFDYNSKAEVSNGAINAVIPGSSIYGTCQYQLVIRLPKNAGDVEGTEKNVKKFPFSSEAQAECGDEDVCNTNMSMSANYDLCSQINKETEQYTACVDCFGSDGVWTAVGCIPSNPESVIKTIITIGLAAGGGIVLIMILVGSFMLSVSQGDPNKTKEAKEIITSAIIGLLFVIFSVTILQFIGVSILHIPGFGGP